MQNILYTIGNTNLKTVNLVAKAISENLVDSIDKLVIFETNESYEVHIEQVNYYKKYLGDFIVETVFIHKNGSIDADHLNVVFAYTGNKYVDLTNGNKITSSELYASASLCSIENIYYLFLKTKPNDLPSKPVNGKDYEYIKVKKFQGLVSLAKISYFDLIYYNSEVEKIFTSIPNKFLYSSYQGIVTAISTFFKSDNYRSAVNNATIGIEGVIKKLRYYFSNNDECVRFASKNGIQFGQRDPVGEMSFFFKSYNIYGRNPEILKLCTLPGLLSALRDYRNLSAHDSQNGHIFTSDEARIVINMTLEVFKCLKNNKEIWNLLERD